MTTKKKYFQVSIALRAALRAPECDEKKNKSI